MGREFIHVITTKNRGLKGKYLCELCVLCGDEPYEMVSERPVGGVTATAEEL
jgi:hypothetical protein